MVNGADRDKERLNQLVVCGAAFAWTSAAIPRSSARNLADVQGQSMQLVKAGEGTQGHFNAGHRIKPGTPAGIRSKTGMQMAHACRHVCHQEGAHGCLWVRHRQADGQLGQLAHLG